MKRTILTTLCLLLLASSNAMAKSLLLTLANGKQVYYLLGGEKNPVMKFNNGNVSVNSDVYEISGIEHFVISETDDPNAIHLVSVSSHPHWQNDILFIPSAKEDVKIYAVNGTRISAETSEADGNTLVDLKALPQGVYIVKVGNGSFKITKK